MVPRKSTAISPAMAAIVRWALRTTGSWKMGTALLIASTPVRAVAPLAKVRSSRKIVTGASAAADAPPSPVGAGSTAGNTPGPRTSTTPMPQAIMPR